MRVRSGWLCLAIRRLLSYLDGAHGLEELVQHPHQAVVIRTPVHLGAERAALDEVLRRAPEREQHDLVLLVTVLVVRRADVRRAVAQDHVRLGTLHLLAHDAAALLGGDVRDVRDYVADGPDGEEVDGNNEGLSGHGLGADLGEAARGGAEVDADLRFLEEVVLLVDLDQLEGGTGAVPLLLGQVVVLILKVE